MLTENEIQAYQQALAQQVIRLANECRNAYEWGQRALDGNTPVFTDATRSVQLTTAEVVALQGTFNALGLISQVLRGNNAQPVNALQPLLAQVLPRLTW